MGFKITAAELEEGNAQYARIQAELADAERDAEEIAAVIRETASEDHSDYRRLYAAAARVKDLRTRLNSLAAFLQLADVEPAPAAPRREVTRSTEPRRSVAKYHGTCRVSQQPIRPGDAITEFMGCWAHSAAVDAHLARIAADREARQAAREYTACFDAFVGRLPEGRAA